MQAMKQCFNTRKHYYYGDFDTDRDTLLELVLHMAKETTQLEIQPIIVLSSVVP